MMQAAGILGARDQEILEARFKAMVAVTFFGFLCPSKLCMTDAEHYLRVKDVRFTDFKPTPLSPETSLIEAFTPASSS